MNWPLTNSRAPAPAPAKMTTHNPPSHKSATPLPAEGSRYSFLLLLAILVFIPATLYVMPSNELGAIVTYLVVLGVGMFILYHAFVKRVDPGFPGTLFALAYVTKLLACVARYWMIYGYYGGGSDATLYFEHGEILAHYYRVFDFSVMETYTVRGEGTTMLAHITGLVFGVLPISMSGAFFFFSTLAFTGTVFCYAAARIAWPDANLRHYTLFIFFLPSIIFWPASLGKDAWIMGWTGIVAWAWANYIYRQKLGGLFWIAVGLLLLQLVRPHVAAFMAVSIGASYLLYNTRGKSSILTWVVGGTAVVVLSYLMVQRGAEFLNLEELSVDSLQDRMEEQQRRTTQGGSSYEAVSIFTPRGFIQGLITVAFRPFPWEAGSPQMLITSLETLGWMVVLWIQRRAFWQKVRNVRNDPMAAFALCYTITMLLALTSLGNFGIVARQRVMALPFLWMLFVGNEQRESDEPPAESLPYDDR